VYAAVVIVILLLLVLLAALSRGGPAQRRKPKSTAELIVEQPKGERCNDVSSRRPRTAVGLPSAGTGSGSWRM
jgi:hypothetical protein